MKSPASTRRSFKLLGWAVLPVLILAAVVQTTGVGIDLLVVAAAGLVLFGLERSVGDWLGEWFGPLAAALMFVAVAVALSWYFLSDSLGRSQTERFFVEAERRGYKTVYYETATPSPDHSTAAAASSADAAPAATSGRSAAGTAADAGEQTQDREATPDEVAGASLVAESSGGRGRQKRSVLSFLPLTERSESIATETSVRVSPSRVLAARRAIITATVRATGLPVGGGNVEFMVNGLGAGRIAVNREGIASTSFATHLPGSYEVRARFSGTGTHASSRSETVLLTVVTER